MRSGLGRELIVFALIGVVSTAAYALLYLAIRPFAGAIPANVLALLVTAVGNTAANRRLTFRVRDTGRAAVVRDQLAGIGALLLALALTTSAVTALSAAIPDAGRMLELAVLVTANAVATIARFLVLRVVITRDRPVLATVPAVAHPETRP